MRIPKDLVDRDSFYSDLIYKCTYTQDKRAGEYGMLRHYYLHGRSADEVETPYNKIFPHIDTLVSFLFASETTKFSIHLPSGANEEEYLRVKVLNRAVNDVWLASNADQVYAQALNWALVYNSMFIKLTARGNEIVPFVIEPSCFGVLREDMPYTDRQEAMTHSFYTTRSQLEDDLISHPNRQNIIDSLSASPISMERPDGLSRILLTSSQPTMQGSVNSSLQLNVDYIPEVSEDLIQLHELWVWDSEISDYRVITQTETGMTIYDRPNFFLKGENPFIQICPDPIYSYYWGMSEVSGLTGLQVWRNERVIQIRKLLNLQAQPPTAMTGWMGLLEEKQYAMFSEGSYIATDGMQSKIERFDPKIPQDIFAEIREIDAQFAERSGLANILMGKGETGVRSGKQTSELARLSSARIKKRALVVEDSLEKMATMYLKLMQKNDPTIYIDEKNQEFVAAQFTDDYVVKVDAHSNSPLFVEDLKSLAVELLQAHCISRERFIEMISPPDKELILRELKVIEKKEEEAAKKKQEMEMEISKQKSGEKK